MVSSMLQRILALRRRIAPEKKSFRKKRGNTRTQGKKKRKFATAENDQHEEKEEETSVGEMIFRDN